MLARQEGLTKTYNRFHNPDETSADIQKLRQLHVEMDNAVAAAYGWTDLDLGHGFHQTKQGLRYTISEPARREVLARLLKLNHERYAEEVRQGLHEKKKTKTQDRQETGIERWRTVCLRQRSEPIWTDRTFSTDVKRLYALTGIRLRFPVVRTTC